MNTKNNRPEDEKTAAETAAAETAATDTVAADTAAEETTAEETAAAAAENTADAGQTAKKTKKPKKEKKALSAEMRRRLRYGRTARLATVGIVVIAFLFNFVFYLLGNRFPLTLDLSADKLFTLSETSVEMAKSIKEPIEIVVFASEEVFSDTSSSASQAYHYGYSQVAKALSEFYNAVKQYKSYSDGNVTTTFIDLNQEPAKARQYQQYTEETLQSGDILFIRGSRCKTANINTDLYETDTSAYYSTGELTFTSNVEMTLANKLQSLQGETDKVLTIFTGHNEDTGLMESLSHLYDLNGYDIKEVDLTKSVDIDANTVAAVIPAPSIDYSAAEIERLRKWLANDGKEGQNLMVFTHPTADCAQLYEFLEVDYGMEIADSIVVETNYDRMYAYTPNYAFADIPSTDYTKNSAGDAKALTPATRQIIPHWEAKTDTSMQYSINLLTYSSGAKLSPMEDIGSSDTDTAKAYDGTIVGMAVAVKEGYQNALQIATTTRIAVCGSAYMGYAGFVDMSTVENENLLLDTMSALSGVVNTVNISSKSLENATISFATSTQIWVGLILFTLLLPISLLVLGLVVFLKRRHL